MRGLYCTEYDIHDLKSTEQALATREEQLRLFTDNIPEPVVYLDADRKYAFVNESFLQLNGLDRDAVIGKPSEEVIGLEASEGLKPFHDRAFAGETLIYERAMVDAQGRMRWIRGRMVPDHSFDGRIQGVYVVGHDITDLKEAQDALAARESQLRVIMTRRCVRSPRRPAHSHSATGHVIRWQRVARSSTAITAAGTTRIRDGSRRRCSAPCSTT